MGIAEGSAATMKAGIAKVFGALPRCRVAIEVGCHSPWVSRQLQELGHEVIVANPQNVRLIGESTRQDDRRDARTLARLARASIRTYSVRCDTVARKRRRTWP